MPTPLKVTFLLQDTGQLYGAERATLDLMAGLQSYADVHPHVVLIRENRLNLTRSMIEDQLRVIGTPYQYLATDHAFSWKLVQSMKSVFAAERPDCIHAVGYKAAFHCALATRRLPVSWVSTIHGWLERKNFKERLYKVLEIKALRRAQKVIVLSQYYRSALEQLGFPAEQLEWIPSGIQEEPWMGQRRPAETFTPDRPCCLGILGRLSEEKNHRMFLDVAESLLAQQLPVRFLIAGDGPLKQQLAEQIVARGMKDYVSMPGIMPRQDFFTQCDILVSCSHIENLPYSMMEAMACSLPVVATNVGGVSDLVTDGQTGYLVSSDDVETMTARLGALITEPRQGVTLGAAGRERFQRDFTLSRSAERHAELYNSVADQARGTRLNARTMSSMFAI